MYIILENGWEDKAFIAERCEGFDEFKATVVQYPPEEGAWLSEITGIPVAKLREAAALMGECKPMAVIWAMGITQHIVGVRNVMDLANLQMLLGNMGKPGGGVNPLRGQNNVQGACDMGGLPNVFPAYQAVTNPEVNARFAAAWGHVPAPKVGLTVTEMMPGYCCKGTHALYIMGEDPVMCDPDTTHIRHCLGGVRIYPAAGDLPHRNRPLCRCAAAGRLLRRKRRHHHQHRTARAARAPGHPAARRGPPGLADHRQLAQRLIEKAGLSLQRPAVRLGLRKPGADHATRSTP